MTLRVPCPRCGSVQAVVATSRPRRMWPHRRCTNVLAPVLDPNPDRAWNVQDVFTSNA